MPRGIYKRTKEQIEKMRASLKGRKVWNKGKHPKYMFGNKFGRGNKGKPTWTKGLFREKAPSWKGGKYISNGYIYIYQPQHPHAKKTGYVLEHRLVMEKHLGRYLTPYEVVHHKNNIRNDNCIENLNLYTNSEHLKYHALYRKPCSDKTRLKIKINNAHYWLGKKRSEETKKKISKANKNRKRTLETRQKMSLVAKTRPRKPHSEITKRKIGLANKKAYLLKKILLTTL